MKTNNIAKTAIGVLTVIVLLLSGCSPATPKSAPSTGSGEAPTEVADTQASTNAQLGEPYKIGAVFDITGPASSLGIPERDTTQMLLEELQSKGGIIGPDGKLHPVEIIIYDGESDETKTLLAVKKLIDEDQVSAIVGPTQSGTSLAVVDTVQKAGIPLISCATSFKIVEPVAERKWVFKTAPSDRTVVKKLVDYLKSQEITKVAWMSVNSSYGDSGKVEFDKAAPEAGINIVAAEKFEATDTDMTAQLTKIRGTDAQALVIWAIPPAASAVTKNAYDLGMKLPIFHSHGIANQKFIELASKEASEGVTFPVQKIVIAEQLEDNDPQKATLLGYSAAYLDKYDIAPVTFGGHAWDGIKLVLQAMSKVGSGRAEIRDELEKTQGFVGIGGIFDFSASDHNGLDMRGLTLVKIEDGQWKRIEP